MSAFASIGCLPLTLTKVAAFVGFNGRESPRRRGHAADRSPVSVVDAVCLLVSLIGSAYLMAGALGPMRHPAVGWFALVPIFVSIYVLRPVFAGLAGVLWGVSVIFLARYAGWRADALDPWSEVLIVVVPGLYAGLGAALTRWIGFSPFVLAVGWMGVELAVSAGGLRLGLLGDGIESSGWLHSIGMSFGYVVAAFVVAYVNAGLIGVISSYRFVGSGKRLFASFRSRVHRAIGWKNKIISNLVTPQRLPRAPPSLRGIVAAFSL